MDEAASKWLWVAMRRKRTYLKVCNKIGLISDRIESDHMVRHGLMMVIFGIVAGLFNYLYQLSMAILLTPEDYPLLPSHFMASTVASATIASVSSSNCQQHVVVKTFSLNNNMAML